MASKWVSIWGVENAPPTGVDSSEALQEVRFSEELDNNKISVLCVDKSYKTFL